MTIQELFTYCNDVVNKDVHGLPFGPDQFNNTLKFVNVELFQSAYSSARAVAEKAGEKLSSVVFDINDLRNFITMVALNTSTTAVGDLTVCRAPYPTDMEYPLSLWTTGKDVEIVSAYRLARLRASVVNRNFDEHPVAVQTDGYFEVYPNDLLAAASEPELVLTYLKRPSVPYYDYCYDEDDVPVFMPDDSFVVYSLVMGQYNLYQGTHASPTLLKLNVTHPYFDSSLSPNPTLYYDSVTVELEWDQSKHMDLANKIIERMGVNLRSPDITQYAVAKEVQ